MTWIFLICAVAGGTMLVCQAIMALVGLGGHLMDFDAGGDVGHDLSGDFHDLSDDLHGGDVHGGDLHSDSGDPGHGGGDDTAHGESTAHNEGAVHHETGGHAASTWLFQMISFRTLIAALTFFGLAGMAAQSSGASTPLVLAVALAAGFGAMYSVFRIMQALARLNADGTVHVQRTIGKEAKVYLPIPGHGAGAGKVFVNLQGRTMEYPATTSGDPLSAGARVVIVNVVGQNTLEVQPVLDPERTAHA
jgi:membrane protein implicated in regulation of membrane protease activity